MRLSAFSRDFKLRHFPGHYKQFQSAPGGLRLSATDSEDLSEDPVIQPLTNRKKPEQRATGAIGQR
jgi:hypothetical protein